MVREYRPFMGDSMGNPFLYAGVLAARPLALWYACLLCGCFLVDVRPFIGIDRTEKEGKRSQ